MRSRRLGSRGKKDMELDQEICVSLDDEGTYIYAWYDILNADGTDFSEATQIPGLYRGSA